jgi:hypothetical protein
LDFQKRAVDTSNEHSLSIDGKQKAVQKGKNKKQPAKRGKRVPGLTLAYSTFYLYLLISNVCITL